MKRGNTEGGNSGGGGFSEETWVGRFWGRGRFSKRSASPPDPLSRRAAAVRVVFSSIQYAAVSWSAVSCCLVVVTAADRAAATCQRWAPHSCRGDRAKVSKGRSQSPLVVSEGHETVAYGGFAATPCLLPQKEGDHSRSEWWKIYPPVAATRSPAKEHILSQPNG